jgi:hypothetical protein
MEAFCDATGKSFRASEQARVHIPSTRFSIDSISYAGPLNLHSFREMAFVDVQDCMGITRLDASDLPALDTLSFSGNANATEVTVSGCAQLAHLDCSNNANLVTFKGENCIALADFDITTANPVLTNVYVQNALLNQSQLDAIVDAVFANSVTDGTLDLRVLDSVVPSAPQLATIATMTGTLGYTILTN